MKRINRFYVIPMMLSLMVAPLTYAGVKVLTTETYSTEVYAETAQITWSNSSSSNQTGTSLPQLTIETEGEYSSITFQYGGDGLSVTYSVTGVPAGMEVDTAGGYNKTPTLRVSNSSNLVLGNHTIVVTATPAGESPIVTNFNLKIVSSHWNFSGPAWDSTNYVANLKSGVTYTGGVVTGETPNSAVTISYNQHPVDSYTLLNAPSGYSLNGVSEWGIAGSSSSVGSYVVQVKASYDEMGDFIETVEKLSPMFTLNVLETYSVTYDANGATSGTAPTDSNTYVTDESVTVLAGTGLTKDSYVFSGWNTQADGKGTNYAAGSTYTMGTSNATLYAIWLKEITITETTQEFTYDGTTKAFAITGATDNLNDFTVTYSTGNPTDAGSYNVTITRAADSTYAAYNKTITGGLVINKATQTVTVNTSGMSKTYDKNEVSDPVYTYNGDGVVTIKYRLFNGFDYQYTTTKPIDAGKYYVKISVAAGTNYLAGEVVGEFTIERKRIGIDWSNTTITYDGQPHQPTMVATGVLPGDTITLKLEEGSKTDVFTAWVHSIFTTTQVNYLLPGDNTKVFKIEAAPLTVTTGSNSKTYDGTPLEDSTATITGFVNSETATITATGSQTNAGSSQNTYSISWGTAKESNYKISETLGTLTVNQKEIGIDWTNTTFTYDGYAHKPTATATNVVIGDTVGITVSGEQTNAGTGYTATAVSLSDSNYKLPTANTTTFVINKATYNMTGASWNYYGEFHYDRTVQTIYVIDLPDGVTVDSYTNNSKTDPGNYTASVTFSYDTVNYNEPTIEDCNWTIIPRYQIVYNGNGSTEGIVPVDSEYEDKFYLNESEDFVLQGYYGELKKTGKTFVGWNTDSSATTALTTYIIDADDADASFNITLYAIWMDGTHTCDGTTYDVLLNSYTNGGTLTSGYYYLNDNLTLLSESSNLYIANAATVYICLNGYVLDLNGCCISNHGNLHVCDCKNDNDHIHYFNPNADGVWEYDSTETESDYFCKGGVITGGYEAIRSETNAYEFITAELNIINVNFVGNTGNNGGAINTSSNTNIYNSNFFGNKTFTWGGALNANAEILIGGCVFKYNIAVIGGAIACQNNVATIIDTVITDNIAIGDDDSVGGGVYVRHDEAACLVEGTQITMANGTTKKIEDIVVGDKIKSFNHETGEFENNEVYITYKGESKSKYFTLNFASGTSLSICGMHDLLEKSAKKYVTITENNYKDYIGKYFYNANTRSWDKLVSVIKSNEKKEYYSIYVYKTFNAITNGMLTIADDNDCMLNIYEFNDDATADIIALQADIDKYGLLEFEDCVLVQSYEDYVKYNVKYYYIWLGKGLLTYKEICEYAKALYGNTNTPLMLMSVLVGDASTPTYSTYSDGVEASTLILVGDVTITGNKSGADEENLSEDNVYLTNDSYIKVISGATNIDVGVNLEDTTGIFIKAETNTDYLDFFSSDITPGYGIKIEETEEDSGEYNYLVFEKTTVTITEDAQQFTYDGNSKAFDIVDATDGLDDFTISYYVEGGWTTTAPTDFGSYNVKIYRAEDDNYKEYAENVITNGLVINQATTSITDLSITGWTYGDTANTPSATTNFGTIVYTYSDAENGTYTSTVPTNAGTYWVKASVVGNDNYTSDEEKISFTINQKQISITCSNVNFTYNGEDQQTSVIATYENAFGVDTSLVINKIYGKVPFGKGVVPVETFKDAGAYIIDFKFATSDEITNYNFLDSLNLVEFTMAQREIGINWNSLSFAYDTLSHKPTAVATNVVTGDTVELIVSGEQSSIGTHTATASFVTEQQNYKLPENVTVQFTINNEEYTVVFKNYDGTVLSTTNYYYGETPVGPSNPTKMSTVQYSYVFAGWSPEVVSVTEDAEYTATFTPVLRKYTITWKAEDVIVKAESVEYGSIPTAPATPTKSADNIYTYAFAGWSPEVVAVNRAQTYVAQFTPNYIDYKITFINYDNSIIEATNYHYGDTVIPPTTQTKPSTETYYYVFRGWDQKITTATREKTYKAQYDEKYIEYSVIFRNYDGSVISSATYHYNDSYAKPTNPTRQDDDKYTYTFAGWNKVLAEKVTSNLNYMATYTRKVIKIKGIDVDPTNVRKEVVESEIKLSDGVEENISFIVRVKESSTIDEKIVIPEKKEVLKSYNAAFLKNNVEYTDYTGEMTIKIAIPAEALDKDNVNIVIWDKESNTTVVKNVKVEGDYLVFTTSTLGDFVLVTDSADMSWIWILVGSLLFVGIILMIIFFTKRDIIFVLDGKLIGRESYKRKQLIELPKEVKEYKWYEDEVMTKPFAKERMGWKSFKIYASSKKPEIEEKKEEVVVKKVAEKLDKKPSVKKTTTNTTKKPTAQKPVSVEKKVTKPVTKKSTTTEKTVARPATKKSVSTKKTVAKPATKKTTK